MFSSLKLFGFIFFLFYFSCKRNLCFILFHYIHLYIIFNFVQYNKYYKSLCSYSFFLLLCLCVVCLCLCVYLNILNFYHLLILFFLHLSIYVILIKRYKKRKINIHFVCLQFYISFDLLVTAEPIYLVIWSHTHTHLYFS